MKTAIEINKIYSDFLIDHAKKGLMEHNYYPERFLNKVKIHLGCVQLLTPFIHPEKEGTLSRNLIVVVIGDSITAGHFEQLKPFNGDVEIRSYEDMLKYFFIDIDAVYHEQLRRMLWKEYPLTPISIINAGIAGDTIEGIEKRIKRDVVQLQPDLVILNGSMNFSRNHGDTSAYEIYFNRVVERIQEETEADLILVTPNMAVELEQDRLLQERVEVIRRTGLNKKIPLADTYLIWEQLLNNYPEVKIEELMSNGTNHPTKVGHTVYAHTIMNLLKNREELVENEY